MSKRFNVTGICIPEQNYMVDISRKLDSIISDYIEKMATAIPLALDGGLR